MHLNKKVIIILIILIVLVIFLFPFLLYWIYSWNCRQIIKIDLKDMLSYYATVFAIPGSFAVLYITRKYELEDQRKEEEKENEKNKPHFTVTLKKISSYFEVTINGCDKGKYKNIYFYEKRICDIWTKEQYKYKLYFDKNTEKRKYKKDGIIRIPESYCCCKFDNEGYPAEFFILCEDIKLGVIYLSYYKKNVEDEQIVYNADPVEVIYV